MSANKKILFCSFCGKTQGEVRKLIAGPAVNICDSCIDLCNQILEKEDANQERALMRQEIKSELKDKLTRLIEEL